MARFCINCGKELPEGANACTSCGTMQNGAAPAAAPVAGPAPLPAQQKSNGLAIAGFIVSLVSTILCCGSFNLISLILSIVGMVKAKELGGAGKGMAIAGIIISAIGIVILIILTVFGYAASFIESTSSYGY